MERRCFIVGAGEFDGLLIWPKEEDLVIAADGGYHHLKQCGLEPDVLLGDFDSLSVVPEHERLIRHSPIKDDTDMALAVAYGIQEGCKCFYLYGGLGGRLDHTLANLQLLTDLSRKGMEAYLLGQGMVLTAITNGALLFRRECTGMLSVFCMGEEALGVTETGLKYTLDHARLTCRRALGVSNEFIGRESRISVEKGTLLISWDDKCDFPARRLENTEEEV